jgi:S-adenosylmethionine-diacylgycerolhomoserine-N-methlytransferase
LTQALPGNHDEHRAEHRAFLNRYYGISRFFYDVTRKYYLFGRDTALRQLAADPLWTRLIEIGPGTGRNLKWLRRARPNAQLGGIEASDAMLAHAQKRCPWATLRQGFAETAPLADVLDGPPDRILFSYCLSMVKDRSGALANARRSLAPNGEVIVVDFADFAGFPGGLAAPFRSWLRTFHVEPLDATVLAGAKSTTFGPGHYFVIARFPPS